MEMLQEPIIINARHVTVVTASTDLKPSVDTDDVVVESRILSETELSHSDRFSILKK